MFLFSLSLLGLVCSLHDSHLLVKNKLTSELLHSKFRVFIRNHTKAEYIITEKTSFVKGFLKTFNILIVISISFSSIILFLLTFLLVSAKIYIIKLKWGVCFYAE